MTLTLKQKEKQIEFYDKKIDELRAKRRKVPLSGIKGIDREILALEGEKIKLQRWLGL